MKFERYGIGIAKGLTVTLRHLFRHPVTVQYPEQRLNISRRSRGNELVWDQARCTGCATCAKTCPQGVIHIVTSKGKENNYIVEKFEMDAGYCIFCGLCVEACPYNALFLSHAHERARYRRRQLVLSKEDLMLSEAKPVSGYFRPEIEATLPRQTLLLDRDRVKE